MSDDKETIVAAAVYHGCIVSLPPPARHHTIIQSLDTLGYPGIIGPEAQGFVTSTGRYVNRVEGYYVAVTGNGMEPKQKPELFSEDLW